MEPIESMTKLTCEIISAFDARVAKIEEIIASTYDMLEEFRNKRLEMRERLSETLSKKKSLRRTDFKRLEQEIVDSQKTKETQLRQAIKDLVQGQRALAKELQELISNSGAEDGHNGNPEVKNILERLADIKSRQEAREKELANLLSAYCQEEARVSESLNELLANCQALQLKEIRSAIGALHQRQSF